MTVLNDTLNRVYGAGGWSMSPQGVMVDGQLKVPKGRLKVWLAGMVRASANGPSVPIVRPRPLSIPRPLNVAAFDSEDDTVATPMPFLKKPKGKKAAKAEVLRCSKCDEIWEDCSCGHVWCPYCGHEPPSGTQRGLDMHVKAKHPEIDW